MNIKLAEADEAASRTHPTEGVMNSLFLLVLLVCPGCLTDANGPDDDDTVFGDDDDGPTMTTRLTTTTRLPLSIGR